MSTTRKQRYTVHRSISTTGNAKHYRYLILDNGIPAVEVNRPLLLDYRQHNRPESSPFYSVCRYLNFINDQGIEYPDAKMGHIYVFASYLYSDLDVSYPTLKKYLNAISRIYESLILIGQPVDPSLLVPPSETVPIITAKKSSSKSLVRIRDIALVLKPKVNKSWIRYTKWYSAEQIRALAEELPIAHRCVFLLTIYTGYRASSALSVKLSTIDFLNRTVSPTVSKTHRFHVSRIPDDLCLLIQSYVENERSRNKAADQDWVFLSTHGTPMSYHAYNSALKRAAAKVREKHPELHLSEVHTHAGRSTFAAALRSHQLECRRRGEKTFSDSDFVTLMDWADMKCLDAYDRATRIQDVSPLFDEFYGAAFGTISTRVKESSADFEKP